MVSALYQKIFISFVCVCLFIYFVHSFVRSFIHSFIRSFVHSFICLLVHSFVRSFVRSFDHSFIPSLIHEMILDIICSLKIRCMYVDRIIPPPKFPKNVCTCSRSKCKVILSAYNLYFFETLMK